MERDDIINIGIQFRYGDGMLHDESQESDSLWQGAERCFEVSSFCLSSSCPLHIDVTLCACLGLCRACAQLQRVTCFSAQCAQQIEERVAPEGQKVVWFLVSDSVHVRELVRTRAAFPAPIPQNCTCVAYREANCTCIASRPSSDMGQRS